MSAEILPMLRGLYSRRPETRELAAWELQTLLWSLGYADELLEEADIAAARDVALTDLTGEAA